MTYSKLNTPQEQERACLACFLQYSNNLPDYNGVLKSNHFENKVHAAIYTAMTVVYANAGTIDAVLVSEKLMAIGLKQFEDLNIFEYLETLSQMLVKEESLPHYISNIIKYDFARKADKAFDNGKKEIRDSIDKPLPQLAVIIENALKTAGTENVANEEDPIDVFSVMPDWVMKWGQTQRPTFLKVPWPVFTKLYGGLSFGDLYVIAAPPKVGKSTIVNFLAYSVAGELDNNCKVLVLDTELETERIVARNLASISNVNEFKIKNGLFKNNISESNRVASAFNVLDKYKNRVYHKYVANKSIDEVLSIARRWHAKNVKPGETCLIVYDYLKSTQENIKDAFAGYELLGMKTDKLKKLASELPFTSCLTAVQTNRNNETAMSSQIEWHCSNMYRLEKKTADEISEFGKEFGTHKLVEVRARVQGEFAQGADNYVKKVTSDGDVYVTNFINLKIDNFNVTECGSLEDYSWPS
jgi:replicative DNA helicase